MSTKKISFGVKAAPKSAVVQSALGSWVKPESDSEEEPEVPTKKQRIGFFEDGTAPPEENNEKEKLVVPLEKKIDIAEKEEDVEDADYSKIPMGQFGLAVLRGCGWKDGEGLGKDKKPVIVKIPEPRPKGLGIGAVPRIKNDTSQAKIKKEEALQLKTGSRVKILGTGNDGAYGIVDGMDEDTAGVFVRLALAKKTVRVSQYAVQVVTKEEYDKDAKCLNKKAYEKAYEKA